ASNDIVTTVKKLRSNGVAMLPIPENYYDDLEARTDLSPERLEVLRTHNILYAREESGESLQAYTANVGTLFFFEIVERRGYKGFGAVNASIRLAAQARLISVVVEYHRPGPNFPSCGADLASHPIPRRAAFAPAH